ncbi:MAG TPA: SUMF1/EgtB/PvdO family nonheme iron enzyme [Roseiflexaceae bacterium]
MDDEERQQLRELVREHQGRLHVLEQQQAKQGIHAPPHVITEIADIRAEIRRLEAQLGLAAPAARELRQLRQQAFRAYIRKDWAQAMILYAQIAAADPAADDAPAKLAEARRQHRFQSDYEVVRDLRAEGDWQAVLAALDDLKRRAPDYPDRDGLRAWAERESVPARIQAGKFAEALDLLEAVLKRQPADRAAAVLTAALIENPHGPRDQRMRAGELAGRIGDPRYPVTSDEWKVTSEELRSNPATRHSSLVTSYWCFVSPSTYRIGGWEQGKESAEISLLAFWIARYPVTVAQYAPFVKAGYGAAAERWWTPEGWKWRSGVRRVQPSNWEDPNYGGTNQPVIGVSWYEAAAFCAWLNEQAGDALPPGCAVRLPTEAEWEAAAAHDAAGRRRAYPWGNAEPTPDLAIYDASGLNHPAPVGTCPAGAAACGALDMAGNVWEATASSFAVYPSKSAAEVKDFTARESDVPWRGGRWNSGSTSAYVRSGTRIRSYPNYGWSYYGFRVVVAPRSD